MYNLEQFEADIQKIKPRVFDTYILPGFLIYYAIRSKAMGKRARRMLFVAGVYMGYRSYNEYKKVLSKAITFLKEKQADEPDIITT